MAGSHVTGREGDLTSIKWCYTPQVPGALEDQQLNIGQAGGREKDGKGVLLLGCEGVSEAMCGKKELCSPWTDLAIRLPSPSIYAGDMVPLFSMHAQ